MTILFSHWASGLKKAGNNELTLVQNVYIKMWLNTLLELPKFLFITRQKALSKLRKH